MSGSRKTILAIVLVSTLGLLLGYGYLYEQQTRQDLIAATEQSNINYARLLLSSNWPQIQALLQQADRQSVQTDTPEYVALHQRLTSQVANLKIVKLKIFQANGNTIYSTDPSQVNSTRHDSPGFQAAMSGNVATQLNYKNSIYSFSGEIFKRDVMSSYIPIHAAPDRIENAMEIYTDVSAIVEEFRSTQRWIYGSAITIASVLVAMFLLSTNLIRRSENARRQRLDYIDNKTGLANSALFTDRLNHALSHARRKETQLAVISISMPQLKKLCFNLSEEDTDQLYIRIANRILRCIRESDTLARQENGDFYILLDLIANIESTRKVAQRIIQQMTQPFAVQQKNLYFLPAIGISVFPHDGENTDTILKAATTAMHKARDAGKAMYCFYTQEMSEQIDKQLELESQLLAALDRDEFQLHYQPLIDIDNKKGFGVEALIRWQSPTFGLVPPLDFIPLLEETGLIVPVGNWVLATACEQVARWQHLAPEITVHVNLSARQFRQPDFLHTVKSILEKSGLKPESLDLEITESLLIDDVENVIRTLKELNGLGVNCSIDDFGTGYSSLSYLKRLPIQTLKIDRSFIRDLSEDTDDAAIVEAISALSNSLHLRVIAEGVENTAQQEFLHRLGIHHVQGFLYSKPLPAGELESILKDTPEGNPMLRFERAG